jgi:hypothetical protein
VLAGAYGLTSWNWLHISLVWVSPELRRQGTGRRLITAIEDAARARGCTHAHLDTFSYQARPFYEKLGYEVFGALEDYPPGHQRFFLRKPTGRGPRRPPPMPPQETAGGAGKAGARTEAVSSLEPGNLRPSSL